MYKYLIAIIAIALAWKYGFQSNTRNPKSLKEYDYIVVGAGSAGGIVAARLSENAQYTVALLEAGPDNDEFPEADVPFNMWDLQKTDVDWAYETVPQNYSCQGMIGHRSAWPRGKSLGGTSLINAMMVTRGSKYDYDHWAEMGNTEWSYDKVLPYLRKIETVTKDRWRTSGIRGSKGPVHIEEQNPFSQMTNAVLESVEKYGYKTLDINDKEMIGWMVYQANQDKGVRESTARAYIKPAMQRSNFHVMIRTHATKIVFEGKQAVGVQVMQNGKLNVIRAKKEIILSAGAIGSPQILMLSGIGPKEHLEEFNIPVVEDLPVGKNLYDHIMTDAPVYTFDKPVSLVHHRVGLSAKLEYNLFGTGPLTLVGTIATGFERSKIQRNEGRENPDMQWILFGTLMGNDPDVYRTLMKALNMKPEVFKALNNGLNGRDGMTMLPNLVAPYSFGEIKLKSANPFEYPLINPNYLKDERDVKIMIEAIRRAQQFLELEPLKAVGVKRVKKMNPLCKNHKYDSDEYWECHVRSNTFTVYHPVGTCKMAPDGDLTSVVDQDLRVRNIKGLRVADASIMPYITSGNTNFPCMMIGEKAADIIKGQA